MATRRRRRSNSHHATHRRRRRHTASNRRRVTTRTRRRKNAYPLVLANRSKRRHNRRRRRNPGIKDMGKTLISTVINGAVDSAFGAAGWMAAQAGSALIPITDSSSTEILGLQPMDTLKRLGTSVLVGFLASMMKLNPTHVRMLVMGGFLNSTLSIVESLIPTGLAGNLGLYPGGQQALAGYGANAFVPGGFFPRLPGGVAGDGHGDPAFMGAYYHGH